MSALTLAIGFIERNPPHPPTTFTGCGLPFRVWTPRQPAQHAPSNWGNFMRRPVIDSLAEIALGLLIALGIGMTVIASVFALVEIVS